MELFVFMSIFVVFNRGKVELMKDFLEIFIDIDVWGNVGVLLLMLLIYIVIFMVSKKLLFFFVIFKFCL